VPHKAETTSSQSTWTAFDLQRYLLALSYNGHEYDFTLLHSHFPKRITLSETWHETFERMRQATARDGRERWCMVGVTETRDRVMLSQPLVATGAIAPFVIDVQALDAQLERSKRLGLPYYVSDIHSHPNYERHKLRKKCWEDEFSGGDLEEFLDSKQVPAVMFLVGPTENTAVFRSQETEMIDVYLYDRENYYLFWSGKKRRAGNNLVIADIHRLTLYKGKPNGALYRVFP